MVFKLQLMIYGQLYNKTYFIKINKYKQKRKILNKYILNTFDES